MCLWVQISRVLVLRLFPMLYCPREGGLWSLTEHHGLLLHKVTICRYENGRRIKIPSNYIAPSRFFDSTFNFNTFIWHEMPSFWTEYLWNRQHWIASMTIRQKKANHWEIHIPWYLFWNWPQSAFKQKQIPFKGYWSSLNWKHNWPTERIKSPGKTDHNF